MDDIAWELASILGDYDTTLAETLFAVGRVQEDRQCSPDTAMIAEGLVVAVIMDKATPLIPEEEKEQQAIFAHTDSLEEVYDRLPERLPLIYEVCLGYAMALSQSRYGWRPWERLRDYILENLPEVDDGDVPDPL